MTKGLDTSERALKVRSLLESYYSAQEEDGEQEHRHRSHPFLSEEAVYSGRSKVQSYGPSSPTVPGAQNVLDDPNFDSLTYVSTLIKQSRLGELIEKQRTIASDASNLDYELQNVVYENYSKFLEANDIVGNLGKELHEVEDKLKTLGSAVSHVVEKSEDIDAKLNEQQEVIVRMHQARTLLQKLSVLFELPRKMRLAASRCAFDIVADMYLDAKNVLQKYGDHKAISEISNEVEIYRAKAAEGIRSQLMVSPEKAVEYVVLLSKLDEPIDSLVDIFLSCQRSKCNSRIEELGYLLEGSELADITSVLGGSMEPLVQALCETSSLSQRLFDSSNRFDVISMVRESILRLIQRIEGCIKDKLSNIVASAFGVDIHGLVLEEENQPRKNNQMDEDSLGIQSAYHAFMVLRDAVRRIDTEVAEAFAPSLFSEMFGSFILNHLRAVFLCMESKVFTRVKEMCMKTTLAESSGDDPESFGFLRMEMKSLQVHMLQDFGLVRTCAMTWIVQDLVMEDWMEALISYLMEAWSEFLEDLSARCSIMINIMDPGDISKQAVLGSFMNKALSVPHSTVFAQSPLPSLLVSRVLETMTNTLDQPIKGLLLGISVVKSDHTPTKQHVQIPQSFQTHIANAFNNYILLMEKGIFLHLEQGHVAILQASLPLTGCSMFAKDLASSMKRIEIDFANMNIESSKPEDHEIETTGKKNFMERCKDVKEEMLQLALEKEIEAVKNSRLSKASFQQIQTDCFYLRSTLQFIQKADVLKLLDTLSVTAAESCDEPVMLDPITLDKILSTDTPV